MGWVSPATISLKGHNMAEVEYVEIAPVGELPVGERLFVELDGKAIVVLNVGGKIYAIGDVCTHDDGPLGEGEIDGYEIICPRHGARFDLRDGRAVALPAVTDTIWYPARIRDGIIEIGISGIAASD
jgi:3-phenylpropionate/trans-cinnamate dioxygenase ferredoxin subunit